MPGDRVKVKVDREDIGGYRAHRLRAGGAEALVVGDLGGFVHQIRLVNAGFPRNAGPSGTRELLDAPQAQELSDDPWFHGRVLCPFNDRIPGGHYRWNGQELQFPINSPEDASAIHGLVYSRAFEVSYAGAAPEDKADGEEAVLRLTTQWSERELCGYPFALEVELSYHLMPTCFSFRISTRNTGGTPAPIAFGWHPYFTLGERVDRLSIQADCRAFVPVDETLMPKGDAKTVDGTSIDFRKGRAIGDSVIDIALTAPADGRLFLSSKQERIEIQLVGDTFRYIQLFTDPGRGSIAVEPVTAATNAFNLPRLGLRVLDPGQSITGRVDITYKRISGDRE
jgi:aldose 1-epimerase